MGMVGQNPNQNDTQKRILIATLIAFLFFIAYDILYLQPQQKQMPKSTQQTEQNRVQTKANLTKENKKNIISTNMSNSIKTNTTLSSINDTNIIARIKTKNAIYEIDNLGRIAQVTLIHKQYVDKHGKPIKLFDKNQLKPLEVRFANPKLNNEAFKTDVKIDKSDIDATNSKQNITW